MQVKGTVFWEGGYSVLGNITLLFKNFGVNGWMSKYC